MPTKKLMSDQARPRTVDLSALETLGQNVRVLRQIRSFTQEDLAQLAGMKRTQISNMERGHKGIQLETLDRLAKALAVPAWELLRPRDESGR